MHARLIKMINNMIAKVKSSKIEETRGGTEERQDDDGDDDDDVEVVLCFFRFSINQCDGMMNGCDASLQQRRDALQIVYFTLCIVEDVMASSGKVLSRSECNQSDRCW